MKNGSAELKNLRSFNDSSLTFGIPSKLFGACVIMSLVMMALFSKFFGFLLLMVLVIPLYIIHKDDPEAATLYLSEFNAPDIFTHDLEFQSEIILIDDQGVLLQIEQKNCSLIQEI